MGPRFREIRARGEPGSDTLNGSRTQGLRNKYLCKPSRSFPPAHVLDPLPMPLPIDRRASWLRMRRRDRCHSADRSFAHRRTLGRRRDGLRADVSGARRRLHFRLGKSARSFGSTDLRRACAVATVRQGHESGGRDEEERPHPASADGDLVCSFTAEKALMRGDRCFQARRNFCSFAPSPMRERRIAPLTHGMPWPKIRSARVLTKWANGDARRSRPWKILF